MATWHQINGGLSAPSENSGYVMVSDGPNVMQTRMSFGDDETMARECLANHLKNQPKLNHYLYHNGKLVG